MEQSSVSVDNTSAPKARGKIIQKIKGRSQAISVLRKANESCDESMPLKELVALAEQVPVEKMYRIEIQERDDRPGQALVRVNGTAFRMDRGVEIVVPARVLNAMNSGVQHRYIQDKKTKKMKVQKIREEIFVVLGEVE
ncbi:MAG: hypothetical protein KZQ81_14305 [Candidatus Thiodiazotropha sp. (ex Rostrolucina anterorostrata)]|nr:hypothetical protein [Candidatus Thiodiazotropha sp. (ex Rostrolucina anterorostrata)]